MNEHIPVIADFWETMLFGGGKYRANAFEKHIPLQLEEKHFDRWLLLFEQTVRSLFEGEKADHIIFRAESIAGIFKLKLARLS